MTIIGMHFILLKSSCLFDSPVREASLSVYSEGAVPLYWEAFQSARCCLRTCLRGAWGYPL